MIDKRSADSTAEVARENGAELIPHPAKRSYRAVQYAGHNVAMRSGFDYILQLDADGQHDQRYIPLLLETALGGDNESQPEDTRANAADTLDLHQIDEVMSVIVN